MKKAILVMLVVLPVAIGIYYGYAQDNWEIPRIDYDQDLSGLSLNELRLLRNTVYAVRGYEFQDPEMRNYFWNKPWYQELRREMERNEQTFTEDMLTPQEQAFIGRVKKQEEAIRSRAAQNRRPGQLYSLDLVTNGEQFPKFTGQARTMLEDNGFVVAPAKHTQFFSIYERNEYYVIPNFITSDSLLQLYHLFFDFTLREVEEKKLLPVAVEMTGQLLQRARNTYRRSGEAQIKEAAGMLVVYFAVAQHLLTGEAVETPNELSKLYQEETALVEAHQGREKSPLLGMTLDYSQLIPRGHYTRNEELKKYFRGMMWYGQARFASGDDRQLTAALLMTYYLLYYRGTNLAGEETPLIDLWNTIYEPTNFYVGESDNLTVEHVTQAMGEVYGEQVFKVQQFTDPQKRQAVRKKLESIDPERIVQQLEPEPQAELNTPPVFFMGQRYIPDSYMLQKLVHWRKRPWPLGLDIFAVLGVPEAAELLDRHYREPEKWPGYLPARKKLIAEFAALPESHWKKNLYWSWLDSLRTLLRPTSESAPRFAKSKAWRFKQLHTALASWAELRHDTILYAKQVCAECGGGDEPPVVKGYVEPVPEFFARLNELLQQTKNGLAKRQLLTDHFELLAGRMEDLLVFLERIARKELNGEAITNEEYEEIRIFGSQLEYLTAAVLAGPYSQFYQIIGPDREVAVVADIATVQDQVLEEGVGQVDEIYVIIERDGELLLTRGGVFSYYEFQWPAANRLTDEEWQTMLHGGEAPPRPTWIDRFLAPSWPAQPMP
ncbi:MAG: DUF3160 domain-containing protein, partial [Alphaproteobacteria bacterium]